jgi:hypothetical protein
MNYINLTNNIHPRPVSEGAHFLSERLTAFRSTPFCFHLRNTSFVAEFRSSAMALVQPALKKDDDIDDDCECFLPCQMT